MASCPKPLSTFEGLLPLDLARRNMQFEIGDFYVSRRFKSFIQSIVVPQGMI